MSPFLLYVARAGLYLGLFYAFYMLVMRRTTFFRLNRALLLTGSYLCLLLPFVRLRTVSATVVASALTMVSVGEEAENTAASVFPWMELLLALYIVGALVTLALFVVSACKMGCLFRKGEQTERGDCRLVLLDNDVPSFSWGRKVVMSRKDLEENPAIYTHEVMHVRYRHSQDLLMLLPIQVLFWWNPLVWITREELRLVHEYQADEGVIQKGIDATQYQLLLVRKAVGAQRFSLASGFRHAKLRNRIAMMMKKTSSGWMRWSYLALIPVLVVMMYACNSPKTSGEVDESAATDVQPATKTTDQAPIPYPLVEVKPTFNGGDANEFAQWVNGQMKYPEKAKADGVQGRVTLQFTVGADGVVGDVQVLRGVCEDLDAEAVRAVSASPQWEPGYDADGKAVPVTFTFPIIFKLK